jgi:hypothetical protein
MRALEYSRILSICIVVTRLRHRRDALVWAMTKLTRQSEGGPRIRQLWVLRIAILAFRPAENINNM